MKKVLSIFALLFPIVLFSQEQIKDLYGKVYEHAVIYDKPGGRNLYTIKNKGDSVKILEYDNNSKYFKIIIPQTGENGYINQGFFLNSQIDSLRRFADKAKPKTEDEFCLEIEKTVDDFTNEIHVHSPYSTRFRMLPVVISKFIKNGKTSYYLSLETIGRTVNAGEKGVIVLFSDGKKWEKPFEKIDVDAHEDGFKYSAFIRLTQNDLVTFYTKQIKKFRLYIYDEDISSNDATIFKIHTKCVINQK